MNSDRMAQVSELLERALGVNPGARASLLDAECRSDPELRAEVESLLASHEQAGSRFLNDSTLGVPSAGTIAPGDRIGAYRILERIGRGGMGDVYAAVRADGEFEQKVALKLVRADYATREVVERFRAERQILAGLEHPNIARLFDGGTTTGGAPYLVMELVDGMPIDAFCEAGALSTRERLQIFLQVGAAVQYAHQRLVIHRDVKPSNILVTAAGVPKLLDFGIAKILAGADNPKETVLRPFTPEYASPEQVKGEAVSTASDVYSLGVVLYRVLTGRSPYRLETGTPAELADAITNREPERPTAPHIRGDLGFILLKALRKEPDRRYSSAEQFADDIRRHLEGLPVAARKGTWTYVAGKFVRRHRAGVAAAALVFATLVAGIIVTAREARIAEANRRRAEARLNDVRKLASSLIFEVHDSVADLPGGTDARKLILQRALEYLDNLAKESNPEPDLLRDLAYTYDRIGVLQSSPFKASIGDPNAAGASYEKALSLWEALARANPDSLRDQIGLATTYLDYGEFQSGLGNLRAGYDYANRGLAILDRQARTAEEDPRIDKLTRDALQTLGMMQAGNGLLGVVGTPEQGIAALQRHVALTERAIKRSPSDDRLKFGVATSELIQGEAFLTLGDRHAALEHYRRGIDVLEGLENVGRIAAAARNLAVSYGKIGDILFIEGNAEEALPYYVRWQEMGARLAAADPHNEAMQSENAIALVERGHALVELGRIGEGTPYILKAVAIIEADRNDTPFTRSIEALIRGWYGEALERQGELRQAVRQYATVKERLGAVRGKPSENPRLQGFYAAAVDRLAAIEAKLGDVDAAEREYEEASAVVEPLLSANRRDYELAYVLAETYAGQGSIAASRGRWLDARQRFQKSLEVWRTVPNPTRISTSGFEVTPVATVAARLAECDRHIGRSVRSAVR